MTDEPQTDKVKAHGRTSAPHRTMAILAAIRQGEPPHDIARRLGVSRQYVHTLKATATEAGLFDPIRAVDLEKIRSEVRREVRAEMVEERARATAERHEKRSERDAAVVAHFREGLDVGATAIKFELTLGYVYQLLRLAEVKVKREVNGRTAFAVARLLRDGKSRVQISKTTGLDRKMIRRIETEAREAGLLER